MITRLGFIINTIGELDQYLIDSIHLYYPSAEVMVIGDGIIPSYNRCISVSYKQRLKYPDHGGAWTQRYLQTALRMENCTHFIKLDPDCQIISTFDLDDKFVGVFGHFLAVNIGPKKYLLQGGRFGIDRKSVAKIVGSRMLLDEKYSNNIWYNNVQDLMFADVLQRLEIPVYQAPRFMDAILHKGTGSELLKLRPEKMNILA